MTFLAVVLNDKFKMLSICFLSLELLLEAFFPYLCVYSLDYTPGVCCFFNIFFLFGRLSSPF